MPSLTKSSVITGFTKKILAMTVDQELDYLIWSDASRSCIEYSDLNGQSRRILYKEDNIHPFAMATYSKYLFWIEKDLKTIEKVPLDLNNGNNKQTIFAKVSSLVDLISVQPMNRNLSYQYCVVSCIIINKCVSGNLLLKAS